MEGYDIFLEALKWIALVFLAGFVGYFGKYLGIKIIARFKRDEVAQTDVPEKLLTDDARLEDDDLRKKQDKERLKQVKKESKAKIKQQKRQS